MTLRRWIVIAALLVCADPARAAAGDRKELALGGRVLDRARRPLPGARVSVTGALQASTLADSAGRFTLRVPLGTVEEIGRRPVRLIVEARAAGGRLRVDGGPERLEIRLGGTTDGRVAAESNVPRVADELRRALETEGDVVASVEVVFAAARTPEAARPDTARPSAAQLLEAARERGTKLLDGVVPDSVRAADRLRRERLRAALRERDSLETARRSARRDSARAAQRSRVLAPAGPKVRAAARPESALAVPPPGGCACRVEGTVEVRTSKPLSSPAGFTVGVRNLTAPGQRVELFMGSPREFRVARVPCGTRFLEVLPDPGRGWAVERAEMLGPFECRPGALHQVRIVLVPR